MKGIGGSLHCFDLRQLSHAVQDAGQLSQAQHLNRCGHETDLALRIGPPIELAYVHALGRKHLRQPEDKAAPINDRNPYVHFPHRSRLPRPIHWDQIQAMLPGRCLHNVWQSIR
jgi:hypothetical protein